MTKKNKKLPPVPKMTKKALQEEKPVKLDITFEEAVKKIMKVKIKK